MSGFIFSAVILFLTLQLLWWEADNINPKCAFTRFHSSVVQVLSRQSDVVYLADEKRLYSDIQLYSPYSSGIRFTVSTPLEPDSMYPVIILLGGLEIGRYSLNYLPEQGNNVIIAYEYPYRPQYWYDAPGIHQLEWIRQSALMVPYEISVVTRWIHQQDWYNRKPVILMGYSFGALFIPAIAAYAAEINIHFSPVIIAYGGGNLPQILKANLKKLPSLIRHPLSWYFSRALYPLEPVRYTRYLPPEVLIINGIKDKQIPIQSAKELYQSIIPPPDLILLNEGHMHPRKTYLIDSLIVLSKTWLLQQGAIGE